MATFPDIQLLQVLPAKESLGPSVNLQVGTLPYPSGRVHKHFTYYTVTPGGPQVLHGLHREYTETGVLTETEFRHGAPLGHPRLFSATGQEVDR
jgi:hypothetical protein